jgi:uncharacterized protein YpmB
MMDIIGQTPFGLVLILMATIVGIVVSAGYWFFTRDDANEEAYAEGRERAEDDTRLADQDEFSFYVCVLVILLAIGSMFTTNDESPD